MAGNLTIEDARIIFRNFAGRGTRYNPEGRRNFCVIINADDASMIAEEGWNVKWLKPKEEGDPSMPYIPVAVSYDRIPPKIVLITSGGQTLLDQEEMVGSLDMADIAKADVTLRPSFYDKNGSKGIKAYLKTAYITLEEDELEKKYALR